MREAEELDGKNDENQNEIEMQGDMEDSTLKQTFEKDYEFIQYTIKT